MPELPTHERTTERHPAVSLLASDNWSMLAGLFPPTGNPDDKRSLLGAFPEPWKRIAGSLLPAGYELELVRTIGREPANYVSDEYVQVAGIVFNAANEELGLLSRRFYLNDSAVYHDYLVRSSTSSGVMKPIQRQCLASYDALGITRIAVTADLKSGPIVWAEAGFQFAAPIYSQIAAMFVTAADLHVLGGSGRIACGPAAVDTPQKIRALVDSEQWAIAQFPNALAQVGGRVLLRENVDHMLSQEIDICAGRDLGPAILYAIMPWAGTLSLVKGSPERIQYEAWIA